MDKVSKDGSDMTIGVDLGDRWSRLCVLDEHGEVCEEGRIATTVHAMRKRFSTEVPCRVVIEVGTHSPWVQHLLQRLGHDVITAHTQSVRLIYGGTSKDDRLDAERLARLARVDPKLLHPIRHREGAVQADLAVIRGRHVLVGCRTKLVNHVRGIVKSMGLRLPRCSSESFSRRALEELPKELKPVLLPVLETIAAVTRKIRQYNRRIENLASEQYPETEVLRQVPGIGPVTALSFVLTLEDPARFRSSRSVGAYLGLRPRRSQSGDTDPELRITKAGDHDLRRLLVGAAQYILGPFGPDTDLRRWGLALAARGRKNAKKRAVVAVARKLAVLLHRLWITAEVYEPLRDRANKPEDIAQVVQA